MKMVKKILLGLTVAAVIGFTGCQQPTVGGAEDSISGDVINGRTEKAYVGTKAEDGYTNNSSTSVVREMKHFATKHYGAFVELSIEGESASATNGNGQLGLVFNYTENSNETVNFTVVGFRQAAGALQTYISQFYNIDKAKFNNQNFGCSATKTAYDSATTTPYEIVIEAFPTTLSSSTFGTVTNGEASVGVWVMANENGSYTVAYYNKDKLENHKLKADQIADKTVLIDNTITGYGAKKQTKIGCYTNVYAGRTLKGSWRFSSILGEDLPDDGFED